MALLCSWSYIAISRNSSLAAASSWFTMWRLTGWEQLHLRCRSAALTMAEGPISSLSTFLCRKLKIALHKRSYVTSPDDNHKALEYCLSFLKASVTAFSFLISGLQFSKAVFVWNFTSLPSILTPPISYEDAYKVRKTSKAGPWSVQATLG